MGFFSYLENQQKINAEKEKLVKVYNDIAIILWYQVLYDDVLKHKQEKMQDQEQPFRTFEFGHRTMSYGPVKALTKEEEIRNFEKTAQAVLKDKGFGKVKVKAYPDAIVISKF